MLPDRQADFRARSALPQIVDRPSPNHSSRFGDGIDLVVMHTTEGSFDGAVAWLRSVESQGSAHYVVSPDGRIARLVAENRCAWACGNPSYNRRSISVELATVTRDARGMLVPGPTAFPYSLLWPAAQLVADILRRRDLPPSRAVVIGHDQVPDPLDPSRFGGRNHHRDPGPALDWASFMDDVEKLMLDGRVA
jgi:N-acetyl-anhydromuramyl-L-alanine amidase AmpD